MCYIVALIVQRLLARLAKMEMKFLVLAVVLVAISAAAADENDFGRCTMKKFAGLQGQCTRKFILAFRNNPHANCLKHFERSLVCMRKWIRFCLKGAVPQSLLEATELGATKGETVNSLRELYCGNKEIELPMPEIDDDDDNCDKEFFPALKMYMNNFFQRFRHKRSDPKLCDEYKLMQRNMKKLVKTHCKVANLDKVSWAFDDKYNPFCP